MMLYGGSTAPRGWLLCSGTTNFSYSRRAYPDLFTALQYAHGGSGDTFNVPDMRGRAPIGAGASSAAGGTTWTLGSAPTTGAGGEQTHALSALESGLREHTHNPASGEGNYAHATGAAGSGIWAAGAGGSDIGITGGVTSGAVSGSAHNIMQPVTVLNYIIKT